MADKGTIIYIGGFELPDKNAAAHRVINNGKIFRDLGYNVVFVGIDKSLKANSNIIGTREIIQGFETWSLPYPEKISEWTKYLIDINALKSVFNMYDNICLVVAYNYQAIALNRIKSFCKKRNCKIIADCTEWYSTKGTGLIYKIVKGMDSFLRMRIIQKKLDGLIVISSYLEKYYKEHDIVITVPPLVDLEEKKWELSTDKNDCDKVKLVYSGSPGRNKDKINHVINILYEFRKSNSYVLEVVGITKEEYIREFPNHSEKVKILDANLIFNGRINHTKSLEILKAADACMFVREDNRTTKAGFPTKFVESISCGIPVITTNTSDLRKYLNEGVNGYIIDENLSYETKNLLNNLLVIDPKNIKAIKNNGIIDRRVFHYKNFEKIFSEFMEKIF